MPLIRRTAEPLAALSKNDEQSEHALFLRLKDTAGMQDDVYGCTVQWADAGFVVVLTDVDGRELCAWSGSPDAIELEFQQWLKRRHATTTHA